MPGGRLTAMDKQTEFVLRAMEERDVRFVRLWFTDVLGFLKSVAIAPAELEGAFAEGIGFDGSAIQGFARVYEADMVAHPDPSTFQLLPWRGDAPRAPARMFCDIRHARRVAVVRRPSARAEADAGQGGRHGLHLLHPPRDRVLPVQGAASSPADARRRSTRRVLRPHHRERRHDFRRHAITHAGADGHLGGVQPPRGWPGPAGDRPALRRRADHGRQHHDLPAW